MATVYQLPKDEADKLIKSIDEINRILSTYDIGFDENALYDLRYLKEDTESAYSRLIISGFLDDEGKYISVTTNGGHAIFAFNLAKKIRKEAGSHLEALEIVKNKNIIAIHEEYITFPENIMNYQQRDWFTENSKYLNSKQLKCLELHNEKERGYIIK